MYVMEQEVNISTKYLPEHPSTFSASCPPDWPSSDVSPLINLCTESLTSPRSST